MKTPKEWTKEILSCADNISLCEATMKEALLEYWKHGMYEAAENTFDLAKTIQFLADEKKEDDLPQI